MNDQPRKILLIGQLLGEALSYWSRTLWYQLLMSLLYFSFFFTVAYYAAGRFGLLDMYSAAFQKISLGREAYLTEIQKIAQTPAAGRFYWVITFLQVFLYPLNLGLLKIYRKLDLNEKPETQDLFAGYAGFNFFIFTSYYLFWLMVYNLTFVTVVLAVVWVFLTLFAAPLMFFAGRRSVDGIRLTWEALKLYPLEIFLCCMAAFAFKYIGVVTVFGALFTFPFWNAVLYVLYKNIFTERKITLNPES